MCINNGNENDLESTRLVQCRRSTNTKMMLTTKITIDVQKPAARGEM